MCFSFLSANAYNSFFKSNLIRYMPSPSQQYSDFRWNRHKKPACLWSTVSSFFSDFSKANIPDKAFYQRMKNKFFLINPQGKNVRSTINWYLSNHRITRMSHDSNFSQFFTIFVNQHPSPFSQVPNNSYTIRLCNFISKVIESLIVSMIPSIPVQ